MNFMLKLSYTVSVTISQEIINLNEVVNLITYS